MMRLRTGQKKIIPLAGSSFFAVSMDAVAPRLLCCVEDCPDAAVLLWGLRFMVVEWN